jgi:hypothetical protein
MRGPRTEEGDDPAEGTPANPALVLGVGLSQAGERSWAQLTQRDVFAGATPPPYGDHHAERGQVRRPSAQTVALPRHVATTA